MQDLVVEEGGPAELLCQYSRPVQATWKMDEQEVRADGRRVIIEQDWTVARLSFRPALPCDSGIYSCEAAGTRVAALLHVQGEALHGSGVAGAILNGAEAGGDSPRHVTMPERQGPAGRPPLLPEQPDKTGWGCWAELLGSRDLSYAPVQTSHPEGTGALCPSPQHSKDTLWEPRVGGSI